MPDERILTLSSGVKLRLKPVSIFVLNQAIDQLHQPEVPKQFVEDMGREVENPDHPDYLKAAIQYRQERNSLMLDTLILFGTDVEGDIPVGMDTPADTGVDKLAHLGVNIEGPLRRYLAWVRYFAIQTPEDLTQLSIQLAAASGTPETEVAKAVDSFRDPEPQRADTARPAIRQRRHRN